MLSTKCASLQTLHTNLHASPQQRESLTQILRCVLLLLTSPPTHTHPAVAPRGPQARCITVLISAKRGHPHTQFQRETP